MIEVDLNILHYTGFTYEQVFVNLSISKYLSNSQYFFAELSSNLFLIEYQFAIEI